MPLSHQAQLDLLTEKDGSLDDGVETQVWALLTTLYPKHNLTERRRNNRYAFPYLINLQPVASNGVTPEGEVIVVVGKHLSERGLGFFHQEPLPHRRMIATLEAGDGVQISLLIDLSWCRFTEKGWYESGGRFLQMISTVENEPQPATSA